MKEHFHQNEIKQGLLCTTLTAKIQYETRLHLPQYPGVPHTVCIVTSDESIFDNPKSAILREESSA